MKRLTVALPDELDARLRREALTLGVTVSGLVGQVVASYLDDVPRRRLVAAGAGRGEGEGVGWRVEEILQLELE